MGETWHQAGRILVSCAASDLLFQHICDLVNCDVLVSYKQFHSLTAMLDRNTLVGPDAYDLTYMLAWESLADREKKWAAFFSDPDWIQARADSEKDGPINAKVSNSFLTPTKFSAMQ